MLKKGKFDDVRAVFKRPQLEWWLFWSLPRQSDHDSVESEMSVWFGRQICGWQEMVLKSTP